MINLTCARTGANILINIKHIVCVRELNGEVFIVTSPGIEYAVTEDAGYIGSRDIWNKL